MDLGVFNTNGCQTTKWVYEGLNLPIHVENYALRYTLKSILVIPWQRIHKRGQKSTVMWIIVHKNIARQPTSGVAKMSTRNVDIFSPH